jgi:8-oxo-dGTP pyrophosphatase MutT (NUDIX family)
MSRDEDAMLFLCDNRRLAPSDAVAAIIMVGERYLLQLRDPIPGIFYPGHWGFFGGAIEPGETEEEALRRELDEELGLVLASCQARRFAAFTFDLSFAGGSVIRAFHEVILEPERLAALSLREGRAKDLLTAAEALAPDRRLAPYDSFALWLHAARGRLDVPPA